MSNAIFILGRQPELGLAELESTVGADLLTPIGDKAVMVEREHTDVDFKRFGGSVRLAKLLTYLPYTDWKKLEQYIAQELPKHVCCLPPGKIRFGLSAYGFKLSPEQLNKSGLSLKRVVKESGRSVRVVPNKELELNSAQLLHNQMTGPTGMELLLIKDGERTVLAQTIAVQDIEAYAARDQTRPKRDARVGMLPPKLAQIIINLSVGQNEVSDILDPFCGTGVVLQEALLSGRDAYGTDIDERMIEYTKENLDWLATKQQLYNRTYLLETGDATDFDWQPFSTIACETYLGRPFSALPRDAVIAEVMQDVDTIHKKFLENVAKQTKPGFRMCIAIPAWKTKTGFKHLKTLEILGDLGYTRMSFVHVSNDKLIYHRENQIVARELVVLERI